MTNNDILTYRSFSQNYWKRAWKISYFALPLKKKFSRFRSKLNVFDSRAKSAEREHYCTYRTEDTYHTFQREHPFPGTKHTKNLRPKGSKFILCDEGNKNVAKGWNWNRHNSKKMPQKHFTWRYRVTKCFRVAALGIYSESDIAMTWYEVIS